MNIGAGLYTYEGPKCYPAAAQEAAFLLGGIGTGNISIGSRGQLKDFEIFNQAAKGVNAPFAFFAIWCKRGEQTVTRMLESKLLPPYTGAVSFAAPSLSGLPRLDDSCMSAEYPFVYVNFKDKVLPVEVSLEAFTPFIPLNADDSGIPGAIFRYRVKNPTDELIEVSVAASLPNLASFESIDANRAIRLDKRVECHERSLGEAHGLDFICTNPDDAFMRQNSVSLLATGGDITRKPCWVQDGWFDGIQDFWEDFSDDGRLEAEPRVKRPPSRFVPNVYKVGSVASLQRIEPGGDAVFEFVLSWYFPVRHKDWKQGPVTLRDREACCETVRNYYAVKFSSAWDAASYLYGEMARLEAQTRLFTKALYESTLPDYVLEAVSGNITVLRSNTCFRIENGAFLGWEGCTDLGGSCPGSCTHVWNYAQTAAFLFPELERSMRSVEFGLETGEEGSMAFRTLRVFGKEKWSFVPAADGQMGTIIRLYREWMLSGDTEFLKSLWENAKKSLDYALAVWDTDGDAVLDGECHNTFDIEFHGIEPLTNILFLGALKAMAVMAHHLEEDAYAAACRDAWERGSAKLDQAVWNGEYYYQKLDQIDEYKCQYGGGCLTDQLLGQSLSHITGLGYLLPEEHVKQTLGSIIKYNLTTDFSERVNTQRAFTLGDEQGLVLCSWPHGGVPPFALAYAGETWTGSEYQVAAHLIYENFVEQGLTLAKAVRERFDGYKRSPWNEMECGHHYVRSLSSWALLTALSGFRFDMVSCNTVGFSPKINESDFKVFWSTGKAWGTYSQKLSPVTGQLERQLEVLYGDPGVTLDGNL